MNTVACETIDCVFARANASPERSYRAFLAAIAARDIAQLAAVSTQRVNAALRQMMRMDDFDVLFGLWCESYSEDIQVYGCAQRGGTAELTVLMTVEGRIHFVRVTMVLERGRWKVAREAFRASIRAR